MQMDTVDSILVDPLLLPDPDPEAAKQRRRRKDETVAGVTDYRGRPVFRGSSGGWRSALFVVAVEIAGSFAYFGISANLITYLTGPLGQSNASAAASVNAWSGTASLMPLLGAFLADAYLGRYRSIIIACSLYVLVSIYSFGSLSFLSRRSRSGWHPLAGVWHADSVGDGAGAAAVAPALQGRRRLEVIIMRAGAWVGAGGVLLRVPVPDRRGAGRGQAVRPRLRRRPVRRGARPKGARLPRVPLQLVVLLHGDGHLGGGGGGGLHPGDRRLGRRVRSAVRHRGRRIHRLPARNAHIPTASRPRTTTTSTTRACSVRAAPAAHLGHQPGVRRGVRADHDALQQAGPHPGPAHRAVAGAGAASRRAAGPGPRQHPPLRPRLRPRPGAGAPLGHGQPVRAHHAAARRRGHGHVPGGDLRGGAGGGAAAGHGAGARAGGRAGRHGAHELGLAGAAVRHDGGGRRAGRGGPAGALLRPDARRAPQPGPGALPQRHGHRRIHQQPPHLPRRRRHLQNHRRQLVRRQPQPRPPRLLLLPAGRAQRHPARALPLLCKIIRLQPPPTYNNIDLNPDSGWRSIGLFYLIFIIITVCITKLYSK